MVLPRLCPDSDVNPIPIRTPDRIDVRVMLWIEGTRTIDGVYFASASTAPRSSSPAAPHPRWPAGTAGRNRS